MAEEEKQAEQQDEEAQPKKSRKLLLAIVAVVLLGGLGGGYYFWQQSSADPDAEDVAAETGSAAEIQTFIGLETFIVNLSGDDGREFLRVGVELGIGGDAAAEDLGADAPIPQIRDTILGVLTTRESGHLLTAEGKEELKADLLHALQERLGHLDVREVYFNEFLVQR